MGWRGFVLLGLVSPAALVGVLAGFAAEDKRRPLPNSAVVAAVCAWFVATAIVMLLVTILDELREARRER